MPLVGGLYSGLEYHGKNIDNENAVTEIDNLLDLYVSANKQDSVVSVFMMPAKFAQSKSEPTVIIDGCNIQNNLGGYIPRNNKLLTYPYCFLCVDTLNDAKEYRYERFYLGDATRIIFTLCCSISPNVEIVITPSNYNGGTATVENASEQLVLKGFPQCPWVIDSFRAWLAQSASTDVASILGSIGSAVGGAILPTPFNVTSQMSAVNNAVSSSINAVKEATKGSRVRGSNGGSTNTATRTMGVYYKDMGVTVETAKVIDDFFDKYGYTCNRIKVPNTHVRTTHTYTKTIGCAITPKTLAIPHEDVTKICGVFNKGITFWDSKHIFDYTTVNTPL